MLAQQVLGNLFLPFVAVRKQLLLIVQEFFVRLGRKFVVGPFHNRIHWACLGAESAVNALGHVNVVTNGSTGTVLAFLRFNCNGLGGASGFAELAGNAALLAGRITAQGMLATKARTQESSFKRIVDGDALFGKDFSGQPKGTPDLGQEKDAGRVVQDF